jgi:2-polyprenyl-3-methyl-5-hydroxy-6-metoxy-1,4-benzoquinol methylase
LTHEFIDLVNSPPANSFLTAEQLNEPELFYPLKLFVCENCYLVQIDEYKKSSEIFHDEYIYFSSYSSTWLEHAKQYTDLICERLNLDGRSLVVEVGSNDGYLLQYFKERGILCLGIEPAKKTAEVALQKEIDVVTEFFTARLAQDLAAQGRKADLLIGNNVLAHVPNLNDFISGMKLLLKAGGVITMEFPHLKKLIDESQFDTIYHEHFSYFSFNTVCKVFASNGLSIFDVEEIATHGGSLRIYATHELDSSFEVSPNVEDLLQGEHQAGMDKIEYYQNFQDKADQIKYDLLTFLLEQKHRGKQVIAYGAAAKGSTLLNYCCIKKDLIPLVVDASPHKQGKFMPGCHIPVVTPESISRLRPDVILILPWNLKEEIMLQLAYVKDWGANFVVAIPQLEIL